MIFMSTIIRSRVIRRRMPHRCLDGPVLCSWIWRSDLHAKNSDKERKSGRARNIMSTISRHILCRIWSITRSHYTEMIRACDHVTRGRAAGQVSRTDSPPRAPGLTARDAILITYGDQVRAPAQAPLQTLSDFCAVHLSDVVSGIHILPFYPYSSDDGFSIIDYHEVNPALAPAGY